MAKKQDIVSEERTDTVIYGADGKEILRFGLVKKEYDDNGKEILHTEADNIQCGDGTVINTAMLLQQGKERLVLQICDECQAESIATGIPKNPCSPADKMAICSNCQKKRLCSRHIALYDGKTVCKSCKRKLFWINLLFFRKAGQ